MRVAPVDLSRPIGATGRVRLALEVLEAAARVRRLCARHRSAEVVATALRRCVRQRVLVEPHELACRLHAATARTLAALPLRVDPQLRTLVVLALLARRDVEAQLVLAERGGEPARLVVAGREVSESTCPTVGDGGR